jgi:hypothetical protein
MLRDEYLRRLIDGAHIELYLSANDGARIFWPWRMQPPKEASRRYRDACEHYIIDSDISDPSVTTKECLDTGYQLNAETVALVDYMPFDWYQRELDSGDHPEAWAAFQDLQSEFDSAYDATLHSLREGLEQASEHPFDGQILIPLQEPWVECWRELGKPREYPLGIGGLKEGTPKERESAMRTLRNAVGSDIWIHGFGWGIKGLVKPLRENPDLLDSLDYSTPMQNSATEACTPGKERMSVAAMDAGKRLVRDLREVSKYPDEQTPENLREESQHGMESF